MNPKVATFIVVILIGCLSQFASDIYAPALPAIATDLHASISMVQLSMAIYLFGILGSILLFGISSEVFGRKKPIILGLVLLVIGTLMCLFAPTVNWLIAGRFVQGVGAGAGAGLWRTIFRDNFTGDELAKYSSYLVIAVTFIVPAAPAIGGLLQHHFGWRMLFSALLAYTAVAIVGVFLLLKEKKSSVKQHKLKPAFIRDTFKKLLTCPMFLLMTASVFLIYGGFFVWFTIGPVLLIHVVGISPFTFGWTSFVGVAIAFLLGGNINGRLVPYFGAKKMLRAGYVICCISGLIMLSSYFIWGINFSDIYFPAVAFATGTIFVWPNAFSMAMTPFGDIAGYAGPLYSFFQLGGGAVLGAVGAYLPENNQLPLAIMFILTSVLALALTFFCTKKNQ